VKALEGVKLSSLKEVVLYDFLSYFLPLLPLASCSNEASVSSFDEEEEANSRLLKSLSFFLELVNLSLELELLKLGGELLHTGVLQSSINGGGLST
jgi:hypothetical protein